MFNQHLWNEKSKHHFIDEIVDIALSATQIPLSTFTNLFHQRFEKHSMLESMLEILQQFYIRMETEPHSFLLFSGDSSLYILRCMRCSQPVLLEGSISQTLLHAPTAMLYDWNMIQFHDEQNHRELILMLLLFTSYDNYLRSLKSCQRHLNWIEKFGCQNQPNMDSLCFMRLLRLIWKIPRRHHSTTQYQAHSLSSLCYLKIYLKPSTYTCPKLVASKDYLN
jgi:hypothetical protein